jgi:hypothetical protein
MKLASNWRAVLRHAWSLRLSIVAGVLGAAEVAVEVFMADPPISRGVFAALAALVSLAAAIARVVAQQPISGE